MQWSCTEVYASKIADCMIRKMKQYVLITCLSQNMQLFKEKNKMWAIQLDEVNYKINIKESILNHNLTTIVSLKHKCLSYSFIKTNKRSNLWISSHAIKSEMYKQNHKDFLRLVVRLGYKNSLVFLGFKGLDSKRAYILDLSKWSCVIQVAFSLSFPLNFLLTLL